MLVYLRIVAGNHWHPDTKAYTATEAYTKILEIKPVAAPPAMFVLWRQISVKTPRTTRSHLVVVHLVWFPNTMPIAVGFPNLRHDHEARPRLTRYDLVSRGTTSPHKVRPRLTRSCIGLGNQTLPHFVGISNGMLLGQCVHTNCHSTLHHPM